MQLNRHVLGGRSAVDFIDGQELLKLDGQSALKLVDQDQQPVLWAGGRRGPVVGRQLG